MAQGFAVAQRLQLVDLSVPLTARLAEPDPPRIDYVDHRRSAKELVPLINQLIEKEIPSHAGSRITEASFQDGMALANENLSLDTHSGTHMDAPWHFGPECQGQPTKTIDQIPLEWCFGPGVVLDLRHKQAGELITPEDLRDALERIAYELKPNDIVLLMTGADKHYDLPDYFSAHAGMGRDATIWLLEQGIRVIGIDGWGFDRPINSMLKDYFETGDAATMLPAHMVGREREYCHMEKLANLDQIPRPSGFWVCCFPVKVERGSAGWVRAVALVPEAAAGGVES